MQLKTRHLFVCLLLASCSNTSQDPRHRNIDLLEMPPVIASGSNTPAAAANQESDTSSISKPEDTHGLGEAVYLTATTPIDLMLKQSFDLAWNTVGRALKQSNIKITDQERNKGFYYITYAPGSLLSDTFAFFSSKKKEEPYLLTLVSEGEVTKVSATLMNGSKAGAAAAEKSEENEDKDFSRQLLHILYDTIHDDVKN